MSKKIIICAIAAIFILSGCISPKINVFNNGQSSLKEYTLEGTGDHKILVIQVRGNITNKPQKGVLKNKQGMVSGIVSQLRKAEKDKNIKAVLFEIDSPGGSVTASDILYHEIMEFKRKTGMVIVVSMINAAASGAYYISLPADMITAHPTTITGSIGVIYMRPVITGFMEKIGADLNITKTGKEKDMGSMFRKSTQEEEKIIQDIVDQLGNRFFDLVKKHRNLSEEKMKKISTARVWLAHEARKLGLIDKIGYLKDAVNSAKTLAELPDNSRLVIYRHAKYHDDNMYKSSGSDYLGHLSVVDLGIFNTAASMPAGFYYLWLAGSSPD
ncbi:Signal peptide peptidase [Desulfonema limicola]|uniref:Signal peptide peptidase n=1 Tax=Desulfonema limicola TaxID=45656 RepID=A0A975B584_9BACT|nr:signal peptide peptidase SppA [Desulfonema limicola]QTA79026.1 Signal peptide peptidase [Desulfonema limicola]